MDAIRLGTPSYPAMLAQIPNPPKQLWIRGDPATCRQTAVAVVGARAASREGRAMAANIAADLARAGIVVVSGLARGIDSAAHEGALDGGGKTIAVLGTGIDVVYPPENTGLAARIVASGALLTEFPPGTEPRAQNFPSRNRIISGLSRAVVVIEAAEKSGSLITAREAADQGREVMAVPGSVAAGRYWGCHALLRDGAKLVESAVDILQELGLSAGPPGLARSSEVVEFTVDDVAQELKLSPGEALARLLEWELTGEIQRVGSGRFVRSRSKV
ncbi:MAG: DNA-processing protein DprA [Vicinamibacterales bacterium]